MRTDKLHQAIAYDERPIPIGLRFAYAVRVSANEHWQHRDRDPHIWCVDEYGDENRRSPRTGGARLIALETRSALRALALASDRDDSNCNSTSPMTKRKLDNAFV